MSERQRRRRVIITPATETHNPDSIDYKKLPVLFGGGERAAQTSEFAQRLYPGAKHFYQQIHRLVDARNASETVTGSGLALAQAGCERHHHILQWEAMRVMTAAQADTSVSRYAVQIQSNDSLSLLESLAVEFDSDPLQRDSIPSLTTYRFGMRRELLGTNRGWQLKQLTWHDRLRDPAAAQFPDTEFSFVHTPYSTSTRFYELKVYYPTKPGSLEYGGGFTNEFSQCRGSLSEYENGRVERVEPVKVAFFNPGYACLTYAGRDQAFGFPVASVQYRALAALDMVGQTLK